MIFTLHIDPRNDVKSVGIRGNDKPLNWESDYILNKQENDSLYRAIITFNTGYKFTEVKFTINGEFELQNQVNRRIYFSDKDTGYYDAAFNVLN